MHLAETGCPGPSAAGSGPVGLRFVPSNLDSTAPGCLCEGWGVADAGSGLTGSRTRLGGDVNITSTASRTIADSAISTVTSRDPDHSGYQMKVHQDYHPSPLSPNLYVDTVTVTNTGTNALTDLRYRRAMDWDIEPTAFEEYVTIQGTSPQLLFDSDDGFADDDPAGGPTYIDSEGVCGAGYTGACEFTDLGAAEPTRRSRLDDHGAFDFGFGSLALGASEDVQRLLRRGASETDRAAALTTGGAQVYSLGESSCGGDTIETCCDAAPADAGVARQARDLHVRLRHHDRRSLDHQDRLARPGPGREATSPTRSPSTTTARRPPQASRSSDPLPAGVDFVSATPRPGLVQRNDHGDCNLGTIGNSRKRPRDDRGEAHRRVGLEQHCDGLERQLRREPDEQPATATTTSTRSGPRFRSTTCR